MLYNLENGRRVTLTELESLLAHAVTEYDRKQAARAGKRSYYNPYALAQYLARVTEIITDIKVGAPIRAAIVAGFEDRILDFVLRRIGESRAIDTELNTGNWTYTPVKENNKG